MQMPGRKFQAAGSLYRYGFNGKENDNDVKGDGNQQDYGMRIYDPRLGRFLSIDPLVGNFPFYSPYQFAGNDVIRCIDLDGLEPNVAANKAQGKLGEYYVRTQLKLGNRFTVYEQVTTRPVGTPKVNNTVNDFYLLDEESQSGDFYKLEIKTGGSPISDNQLITDQSIARGELQEMRSAKPDINTQVKTGRGFRVGGSMTIRLSDVTSNAGSMKVESITLNPKVPDAGNVTSEIKGILEGDYLWENMGAVNKLTHPGSVSSLQESLSPTNPNSINFKAPTQTGVGGIPIDEMLPMEEPMIPETIEMSPGIKTETPIIEIP